MKTNRCGLFRTTTRPARRRARAVVGQSGVLELRISDDRGFDQLDARGVRRLRFGMESPAFENRHDLRRSRLPDYMVSMLLEHATSVHDRGPRASRRACGGRIDACTPTSSLTTARSDDLGGAPRRPWSARQPGQIDHWTWSSPPSWRPSAMASLLSDASGRLPLRDEHATGLDRQMLSRRAGCRPGSGLARGPGRRPGRCVHQTIRAAESAGGRQRRRVTEPRISGAARPTEAGMVRPIVEPTERPGR